MLRSITGAIIGTTEQEILPATLRNLQLKGVTDIKLILQTQAQRFPLQAEAITH